jgi:hypothetical protein
MSATERLTLIRALYRAEWQLMLIGSNLAWRKTIAKLRRADRGRPGASPVPQEESWHG